jgi:hypothetical protein
MEILKGGVPGPLWLGREAGQWPIQAWESATHALAWCKEKPLGRCVWLVAVSSAVEHRVVEAVAHLEPVPAPESEEQSA